VQLFLLVTGATGLANSVNLVHVVATGATGSTGETGATGATVNLVRRVYWVQRFTVKSGATGECATEATGATVKLLQQVATGATVRCNWRLLMLPVKTGQQVQLVQPCCLLELTELQ